MKAGKDYLDFLPALAVLGWDSGRWLMGMGPRSEPMRRARVPIERMLAVK